LYSSITAHAQQYHTTSMIQKMLHSNRRQTDERATNSKKTTTVINMTPQRTLNVTNKIVREHAIQICQQCISVPEKQSE